MIFLSFQCQMPRLEDRCWSCTGVKAKDLTDLCLWMASKMGEMMFMVTSVLLRVRSANLIRRGLVLFAVGVVLALVLYFLQIQRKDALFPDEVLDTLFSSAWWIPLCCGTAAGQFHLFSIIYSFIYRAFVCFCYCLCRSTRINPVFRAWFVSFRF